MDRSRLEARLAESAGRKLTGLVHNLNNAAHRVNFQADILRRLAAKHAETLPPEFVEQLEAKLDEVGEAAREMSGQLGVLRKRDNYAREDAIPLEAGPFLRWLVEFWGNDLYFKHHVDARIELDSPEPAPLAAPGALVALLEAGLAAILDAWRTDQDGGERALVLAASQQGERSVFSILARPRPPGIAAQAAALGLPEPPPGWALELAEADGAFRIDVDLPPAPKEDFTERAC